MILHHIAILVLSLLLPRPCKTVQLINLQNHQKWVPVYEIIPGRQYWAFPLTKLEKTNLAYNDRSQRWELEINLVLWSEKSLNIAQSLLFPRLCPSAQDCLVSPLPAQSLRIFLHGLKPHPLHKSSAWSKIEGVLPPTISFHFPVKGNVLRRLRKWQARGHPLSAALSDVSVFVDSDTLDRVDLQRLEFHLDPSVVHKMLNSAERNRTNLKATAEKIVEEERTRIQKEEGRFAGSEMLQMAFETVRLKLVRLFDLFRLEEGSRRHPKQSDGNVTSVSAIRSLKGLLPDLRVKVVIPWSLRFFRRKVFAMTDDEGCERLDCF